MLDQIGRIHENVGKITGQKMRERILYSKAIAFEPNGFEFFFAGHNQYLLFYSSDLIITFSKTIA